MANTTSVAEINAAAAQNKDEKGLRSSKSNYESYDLSYRGKAGQARNVFMIYTLSSQANPIYFWVNPSETQWRIATRTSIEQINGGAVHHEWRSIGIGTQQGQKLDQPVINFSFQSGLIMPNASEDSGDIYLQGKRRMPQGIGNFYDFLELLNTPNTIGTGGSPNYVVINYSSPLFPFIQLEGFFTAEGVQWTESAENPGSVQSWGASFVVFRSDPPLFNGGSLHQRYLQYTFGEEAEANTQPPGLAGLTAIV